VRTCREKGEGTVEGTNGTERGAGEETEGHRLASERCIDVATSTRDRRPREKREAVRCGAVRVGLAHYCDCFFAFPFDVTHALVPSTK